MNEAKEVESGIWKTLAFWRTRSFSDGVMKRKSRSVVVGL